MEDQPQRAQRNAEKESLLRVSLRPLRLTHLSGGLRLAFSSAQPTLRIYYKIRLDGLLSYGAAQLTLLIQCDGLPRNSCSSFTSASHNWKSFPFAPITCSRLICRHRSERRSAMLFTFLDRLLATSSPATQTCSCGALPICAEKTAGY